MLSRVADSIFWMRRYIERAENVARFIDVTLNLTLGLGLDRDHQWEPLVYTTGDQEMFFEHYERVNQANVIRFLTFDERNPNSILSCLKMARENARTSREMLSSQMWEELNKFYLFVRDHRNNTTAVDSPFDRRAFYWRVSIRARCRTARPGTSDDWARCLNGPTRHRAFWTLSTSCCYPLSTT
jgi:uncharacterized alpha-E superfamily protein